jgi:hypothetical protein
LVDSSTFGDRWTHGTEFAIDQEGIDHGNRSNMPCEPKGVPAGLYSPGIYIFSAPIDNQLTRYRTKDFF